MTDTDREDVENLMDEINKQVDPNIRKVESRMAVLNGRCWTVDDLLDVWNERDVDRKMNPF